MRDEPTRPELHEFVHPESLAWLVEQLDEAEMREFHDGLQQLFHEMVDVMFGPDLGEGVTKWGYSFASYIESWRLSIVMAGSSEWRAQMARSQEMLTDGTSGSIGVKDLQSLFG